MVIQKTHEHGPVVITDGFHRKKIAELDGREYIWAVVKEATWDEILDERIKDTENHSVINFGRIIEWVTQSWSLNSLSAKITVLQAFTIASLEGGTGSRLGLSEQEQQDLNAWMGHKEESWNLEIKTIFSHLQRAEAVDEDLIRTAKTGKSRRKGTNNLTQAHIHAFFNAIPNEFELQKLLAPVAAEYELSKTKLTALCLQVKGLTGKQAEAEIANIDPSNIQPARGRSQAEAIKRSRNPYTRGDKIAERVVADLVDISSTLNGLSNRDPAYHPNRASLDNAKEAQRSLKNIVRLAMGCVELIDDVTRKSEDIDRQKEEDKRLVVAKKEAEKQRKIAGRRAERLKKAAEKEAATAKLRTIKARKAAEKANQILTDAEQAENALTNTNTNRLEQATKPKPARTMPKPRTRTESTLARTERPRQVSPATTPKNPPKMPVLTPENSRTNDREGLKTVVDVVTTALNDNTTNSLDLCFLDDLSKSQLRMLVSDLNTGTLMAGQPHTRKLLAGRIQRHKPLNA